MTITITWMFIFMTTRYSSLSAIVSAGLAPAYAWYLLPHADNLIGLSDYVLTILLMVVLLIWRHKSNIKKLLNGTESGFGKH